MGVLKYVLLCSWFLCCIVICIGKLVLLLMFLCWIMGVWFWLLRVLSDCIWFCVWCCRCFSCCCFFGVGVVMCVCWFVLSGWVVCCCWVGRGCYLVFIWMNCLLNLLFVKMGIWYCLYIMLKCLISWFMVNLLFLCCVCLNGCYWGRLVLLCSLIVVLMVSLCRLMLNMFIIWSVVFGGYCWVIYCFGLFCGVRCWLIWSVMIMFYV